MLLFKSIAPLQQYLQVCRKKSASVGFVPTMGALHEGHLSLIRQSRSANDITVCSIFVNPSQFNNAEDLEKYPRTTSKDVELLLKVGNEVLFLPSVETIYPPDLDLDVPVDFGDLDKVMEGAFRPGHFQGVVMVVHRLLDIVKPDNLYMGQKDFQQAALIKRMIEALDLPVNLVRCAIVREADGLAMSSRNQRLTPEFRERSTTLFQSLQNAGRRIHSHSPDEIRKMAVRELTQAGLRVEYFEIADGETLLPVQRIEDAEKVVACVAAWAGDVRLIDNLILK